MHFSKDQQPLIAAQLHHLHEQLEQIHLDVWEKRLGVCAILNRFIRSWRLTFEVYTLNQSVIEEGADD